MNLKVINGRWEKRFLTYVYIGFGVVLVAGLFGLISYIIALDRVTLKVDGHRYQWLTLSPRVADVLREKGVSLKQGDQVTPDVKTRVSENLVINVIRGFPITIKTAGKTMDFFTINQKVRAVLTAAKVDFDENDRITPGLDNIVQAGQRIKVVRISHQFVTKQVTIKPGTEYLKDKEMERGEERVLRQGKPGLVERQIKIVYEDAREVGRYRIAEKIIKPMVDSVVARGIKTVIRTLHTSRGFYRYVELKTMTATAYYPGPESCGKYAADGETYTGKKAGFGLIAVDPRVIKLGTKLFIEGYGRAEAADIGGAIKGNHIDLCFETYREAAMYGTKKVKVYFLADE